MGEPPADALRYRLEAADIRDFLRGQRRRFPGRFMRLLLMLPGLCLALMLWGLARLGILTGASTLTWAGWRDLVIAPLLLALVWVGFVLWFVPFRAGRRFELNDTRGPNVVWLDATHLHTHDGQVDIDYARDGLGRAYLSPRLVIIPVLPVRAGRCILVPRRAFLDDQAAQAFCASFK
jgi:hypothetical protein